MSLKEYRAKRDFKNTPEPKGGRKPGVKGNRFVIQRHQARRLHYDLRLEIDGTLKSWAIPKGPSLNPADKRLAVRTEDHPLEYLSFQGIIPKGNYGAGKMIIWDSGTFVVDRTELDLPPEGQLEKGNLKLILKGSKVNGKFALVKTGYKDKREQWLFIKKDDDFATEMLYDAEAFMPPGEERIKKSDVDLKPGIIFQPMAASKRKEIFNDPKWLYELKWDGYRVVAHIDSGKVLLHSRNGVVFNHKFPSLAEELKVIEHQVILDGEVVVLDKDGISTFGELQNYPESQGTLHYYVFDMVYLNGHSMLQLPLTDRKSLIPAVISDLSITRYCDHLEGMGKALFDKAVKAGMEGIIAKKSNSHYKLGTRSEDWVKVKSTEETVALICGYTKSTSKAFGSLILGEIKDGKLVYIGNCGSGFSSSEQKRILNYLKPFETGSKPFIKTIPLKGREPVWCRPVLRCEVTYSEVTSRGLLRNPVYKRLMEEPIVEEKYSGQQYSIQEPSNAGETLEVDGYPVPISNLDKIYWPDEGFSKYDLIEYYLQVSDTLLPYLRNRPQSLHRHPNGIDGESFYQKDYENPPDWMETFFYSSKSSDREINYLVCQNTAALIFMANLGCIELHPWHSRIENPEMPDYGIIDIDPLESTPFKDVRLVAKGFQELLTETAIDGYCKTSGSKGLHIYIPMGGRYTYEEVRVFIQLLCNLLQNKLPKISTTERSIKRRGKKIYLDALQNRKGQTIASPYSVRPVSGARVSAPISWSELEHVNPMDFTIKNMPERIGVKGDLFKGIFGKGIDISKKLEVLEKYLP